MILYSRFFWAVFFFVATLVICALNRFWVGAHSDAVTGALTGLLAAGILVAMGFSDELD